MSIENPNPSAANKQVTARPPTSAAPSARPVPVEEPALRSIVTPETPVDRCPTNLDLTLPREAALAVAATQVPDIQFDGQGRAIVKATRYIVYGDYLENQETGELEPVIFTALIDREGRIFKTSGVYAPRAVRAAADLFSRAEWDAGITFIVTERLTKSRRVAHDLRILIDAEDTIGPAS